MSQVEVKLYAMLRQHVGGAASVDVEIEPGATVRQVLGQLGVPSDQTRIIFVNGRAAGLDSAIEGGELLAVFPAIGGG